MEDSTVGDLRTRWSFEFRGGAEMAVGGVGFRSIEWSGEGVGIKSWRDRLF